jgi:hypothetical protein
VGGPKCAAPLGESVGKLLVVFSPSYPRVSLTFGVLENVVPNLVHQSVEQ